MQAGDDEGSVRHGDAGSPDTKKRLPYSLVRGVILRGRISRETLKQVACSLE